ncbi:iron-containing redox enzyme family protein [Silanimonas algicola]
MKTFSPLPEIGRFHARLIAETAEARAAFQTLPILGEAVQGRVSREDYIAFLIQAYHHVRHTTPLLMACGSRLPARLEWLREAIAEYIEEEVGHQEWILDDLETLGVSRAAVLEAGPSPATELMVAYAYDTIHRGNPVGFFGMVLVLEGTSVALATRAADVIETTLGLPKKAFRYLRSHGSLDVEHTGFYEGLMDRLHEPSDQAAVMHAARMFYGLYGAVFQGLRNAPSLAVAA